MSKANRNAHKKKKPIRLLIPLLPVIGGAFLFLGTEAEAAAQNITLGKPVTSSGFVDPYEPSRAVDGSQQPTSRWYQAGTGEKWIQVDLGDYYRLSQWTVTGMGVYPEWSNGLDPYNFHLETSPDGTKWQTVDTVQGNTNSTVDRSLPSVEARYVRLVIDQGNASNNQWASVLEFAAYGETMTVPATPVNFTGSYRESAVQLGWDASAMASSYELSRNGTVIYTGPLTSYKDADVMPAGEITYSLQAVNAKGRSTAAEITVNIPSEAERAAEAAAALAIGYASGDNAAAVTQDVTLPLAGLGGAAVSWSSNTPDTVSNDGKVARPPYDQGDRSVELTAKVAFGAAEVTRTFDLTVLKETAETALARAERELTLGDLTAVAGSLTLPAAAYGGTQVEWSSSEPDIIAPDGTVRRPAYMKGDADVTLTAVLRLDGLERTKTFTAHVLSLPISDEEAVRVVHQSLTLPVTTVTYDLELPDSGADGVSITWSSSRPDLLDSSGRVTLPGYLEGDQIVALEATVSRGQYSLTKQFSLLLPAQPLRPEEAVRLAADMIALDYTQGIKDSIALPRSGAFGTGIAWESDRPEVLDTDGRVNRPVYSDGDAAVQLTATVFKDAASVQRTFKLTVLKALPNMPYVRLNGTNPVLVESGDSFTDPGASVVESVYGTVLAAGIQGTGTVDTDTPGIYALSYNYSSGEGWTAEPARREVQVRPRPVSAANGGGAEGSVTISGAAPGARLELYNSGQELVAEATASAGGEYIFTPLAEGAGYYAVQVVNGMTSSPSALVFVKSLTVADVAASIISVQDPARGENVLRLPAVPSGFRIAVSSSHPSIVRTDGVILPPAFDTQVSLVLEVAKDSDGSRALTRPMVITVPGTQTPGGGGSSDHDKRRSSSTSLQRSILLEQGRTVMVYTLTAAFLDEQIRRAKSSGSDVVLIELADEKQISRVISSPDLLSRLGSNMGVFIQSQYAEVKLPPKELVKLAASGQELRVSLDGSIGSEDGSFSSGASEGQFRLAGPAVRIENTVAGTSQVQLPVEGMKAALSAAAKAGNLYVLAYYADGSKETLPAEVLYDTSGQIIGAAFVMKSSGTFAAAVTEDASVPPDNGLTPPVSRVGADPEGMMAAAWTDAQGHWAADALQSLAERGWMQGYEDGTVRPDRPVTRAEFVSMLIKVLGTTEAGTSPAFSDLEGHWAASAIQSAYAQGWIRGVSSGAFGPDDSLTREQAMVILANAAGTGAASADKSLADSFTDGNQVSGWAVSALQQAVAAGWVHGYPDGTLKPAATISRGETAKLLIRALELK
ncbi:immunoglobulin-like domain-containing protein [Paenibacillus jiagnxiensis]|uniref:immunoglobulin-like domain-containing protein n=1 Tax=Paenibacillus jiagnxiensis TaxID=3228926 RepID=UPI0033AED716